MDEYDREAFRLLHPFVPFNGTHVNAPVEEVAYTVAASLRETGYFRKFEMTRLRPWHRRWWTVTMPAAVRRWMTR